MKFKNIFNLFNKEKNAAKEDKFYFIGAGGYSGTHFSNPQLAIEGYIRNIIVYKCISLISSNVALMNFDLYQGTGKTEKQIDNHKLLDLLKRPYPQMTKTTFIRDSISYLLIYGNAYIEKRKGSDRGGPYNSQPPIMLSPLRSDFITNHPGPNQLNRQYDYNSEYDGHIKFPVNMLGKSNLIHIKEYNPRDYFHGLSPMIPAVYSIDLHNEIGMYNNALMLNGATPSGVLKVPKETKLSPEQIQRLKADIKDKMSGSKNNGKPLLLEGGMEWQAVSVNAKDGEFAEMKRSAAHEIGLAFNVPIELLNTLQAKYDNLRSAYDQLYSDAVIPAAQNLVDFLNMDLTSMYGPDLELRANFSHTPVLIARKTRLMNDLNPVGFVTKNEKRKMTNFEEREDGEEYDGKQSQPSFGAEANSFIEKEIRSGSTVREAQQLAAQIYEV